MTEKGKMDSLSFLIFLLKGFLIVQEQLMLSCGLTEKPNKKIKIDYEGNDDKT